MSKNKVKQNQTVVKVPKRISWKSLQKLGYRPCIEPDLT